jgi:hypothetical protein
VDSMDCWSEPSESEASAPDQHERCHPGQSQAGFGYGHRVLWTSIEPDCWFLLHRHEFPTHFAFM